MRYFLTFLLLCSAASFADSWPSNRGYGDLFFRPPPGPPQEQQRQSDRQTTIYSYPDYYYGSPGYYPSYPSSPGYDPFPDATRAKSIYDENVKK